MATTVLDRHDAHTFPADLHVEPSLTNRDRLTTAFRVILGIPHLLIVGGPLALTFLWSTGSPGELDWGAGGGVLGVVAGVVALISWFAILFTGKHPQGLWDLAAFYLRWRIRAVAYLALLRDEYPPFGDGAYPAELRIAPPAAERDRLTVGFRLILAIPHLLAVWALGVAWALVTVIAWFAILFTGEYPASLHSFAVGVFRWSTRVEAYLLLLTDVYPPFSLD